MIVTVTPNPAYDVTYAVQALQPGSVHRVTDVRRRVGGKGVNVARVLRALGEQAQAVALADREFGAAAASENVDVDVVPGPQRVRQTLVLRDAAGTTTSLWEPGAAVEHHHVQALTSRVAAQLPAADVLVVSGSLPPGAPTETAAELAGQARAQGVHAIVDTSGAALREAARVPGVIVTPNTDELAELVGSEINDPADVAGIADSLLAHGPSAVVATLGERGMVAVTADEVWHARLDTALDGNPTGAGDAAVAGLAMALSGAASWPAALVEAVSCASAALFAPVAGQVDAADRDAMRRRVRVRQLTTTRSPR